VYRPIIFVKYFIIVAVLLNLQATADSLTSGRQSSESVGRKDKKVAARDESLAVEQLLKDLEITIDDSTKDSEQKNKKSLSTKKPSSVKTAVTKKSKHTSETLRMPSGKKDTLKNSPAVSFKKVFSKVWLSIPGANFIKTHFKGILYFLVALLAIGGAVLFFHWRRDIGKFLTTGRLAIMDKMVQNACDYIEENYANDSLDIEVICETLVTGEAFLQALFYQELGISVENFIIQVRVNRVKYFVNKDTTVDNDVLAQMCGFKDCKTMEDQFHSVTGATLDIFRKSVETHENN
jgi:AraC-like DNA-binding protein